MTKRKFILEINTNRSPFYLNCSVILTSEQSKTLRVLSSPPLIVTGDHLKYALDEAFQKIADELAENTQFGEVCDE